MPSPTSPPLPDTERLERLVARTTQLHKLTAHLSSALTLEEVAGIVVDEGTAALQAGSGALWGLDKAAQTLVLVRARQYPAEVIPALRRIPLDPQVPICDAVVRCEPVWLSSRADYEQRYPRSAARTQHMERSNYSVAALPIVIDGKAQGVFALTFMNDRGFDADERSYLQFLALHCAQGFERARLYSEAEAAKQRAQFLAKASAQLGGSLDYEQTLANVASLAVPRMADWCGIDLLEETGGLKQVAVAHIDPAKVEFARQLRERYPPNLSDVRGLANVLRTGVSELYPDIPDELLVASAVDAEHLRITRELGLRSAMVVAIKNLERVVGAITFVASTKSYTADDLLVAEQIAERAGAAITNAQLYRSARDAIHARDEFMLVAGHELRTPLAALLLHHEALLATKEGTPLEKIRERGVKLHAQTERLARLVEDLLDVSRLSAGRLTLEPEQVDLGALTQQIVDRMHDDIERANAAIATHVEPLVGTWDKARIDQVITNLLTNALKYGRGAPIQVRVSRDGDFAKLEVQDQGIGIEIADQLRIFKRFERAVSPRKFGGLGLGLWIASQLVAAHHGAIRVSSAPGQGATFTVLLPLARA